MNSRKWHKIIGLILVLPMIGWTITGIIFFIKPGYDAAYEQLKVKTYPIEKSFILPASLEWQEAKIFKTILGYHLLVKKADETLHLNPDTFAVLPLPTQAQYTLLVEDAIAHNKARYGHIVSIDGLKSTTSHDVDLSLNWQTLTLRQKGQDTKLIKLLYKIHYLQWSPFKSVNQILGIAGLLLLMLLTGMGVKVYLNNKNRL